MKNRVILGKVRQRGPKGYEIFKQCLKEIHQEHLVDEMEKIEQEIESKEGIKKEDADKLGETGLFGMYNLSQNLSELLII